ncbi:hypothetical protein D3C73_885160 [compost metagenome]
MLGTGQGDVKQAQVLGQPFIIRQGDQCRRGLQAHLGIARFIVVMQRQTAAIHGFCRTHERQEHQRILQPLGLVDGHDLDQLLVALQAQDLLFARLAGQRQVLGQMANQGLLAIELGGGLLQQLGQVQQVGQHPLAVIARDQGLRQLEVMQQTSQHWQHALLAP